MKITLNKISIKKGEKGKINLVNSLIESYDQLQVEIFDTGKINSKSILGFGVTPTKKSKDTYDIDFNTDNLDFGIYEIKLIRLHSPISENIKTGSNVKLACQHISKHVKSAHGNSLPVIVN